MGRGLYGFPIDPEVFSQFLEVNGEAEDPDRSGDGFRLGEDPIALGGYPVASGRGYRAHRDHYGDARLSQLRDFTLDGLGGGDSSPWAVDAQDHGVGLQEQCAT